MFQRLSLLIGLIIAAVLVPAAAAQARPAPPRPHQSVEITGILYDPSGPDFGRNLRNEVIVIRNTDRRPVFLNGWTISDRSHFRYTFRHVLLRRGDRVTLHTGQGRDTSRDVYWNRRQAVWNNEGDTAFLRNNRDRLVDVCSYRGAPRGFVLCHH